MRGFVFVMLAACGASSRTTTDARLDGSAGGGSDGSGSGGDNFPVYAHGDHVLYSIDLANQSLVTVGNFNAPLVDIGGKMKEDVITDLAVAPDGTIYVVSETELYTANAADGHVTQVGTLSTCGQRVVALTTTPDGQIWTGDFTGNLCRIDITMSPPQVQPPITMGSHMALAGDMVAVDSGTVFGTAYDLNDNNSQDNNVLVKIDLTNGAVTQIGASGFGKLFGTAFQQGKVFAFSHDGTGDVVTIDPTTGAGTVYATFTDPTTSQGIAFAGAGVSSLVIE